MRYQVGQLTVGQIIDQSIKLAKDHFKLLFGIVACFYLPVIFLQSLLSAVLVPAVPADATPEQVMSLLSESFVVTYAIVGVFTIILLVISGPLTYAAITFAVGSEYMGRSTTVKESIGQAFSKFWAILKTGILSGIFIMVGLLLFVIPGIYLTFKYYLAQQVVMLEDVSGFSAMKRSGDLMRGNMGIAFVLGVVLWIASFVLGFITAILPIPYLDVIIVPLGQSLLFLVWCIAAVVLYFHCRAKNENYDLTLLADQVGSEEFVHHEQHQQPGPPPLPTDR